MAFLTMNGVIAVVFLAGVLADALVLSPWIRPSRCDACVRRFGERAALRRVRSAAWPRASSCS